MPYYCTPVRDEVALPPKLRARKNVSIPALTPDQRRKLQEAFDKRERQQRYAYGLKSNNALRKSSETPYADDNRSA